MAESLKSNRAFFHPGKQRGFLLQSKKSLNCTWKDLAEICHTSLRNLNSWRNENNSMSFYALDQICRKQNQALPRGVIIKDAYWYTKKGASAGGKAIIEKYGKVGGDEMYRRKKWREWWEKEGKLNPSSITNPLPFKKPRFSKELAEFVGILLGDGGISERQIIITLHRVTDQKYSMFVRNLIEKLFHLKAGIYCDTRSLADSIVISRTGLVQFCVERLGLQIGNKVKHQVDIPLWIKGRQTYRIACLRGLIDTDGSVYTHSYTSQGKRYRYKKIQYTSLSKPLARSAYAIMKEDVGLNPRLYREKDVKLESQSDVKDYLSFVGTHNKKHMERYKTA